MIDCSPGAGEIHVHRTALVYIWSGQDRFCHVVIFSLKINVYYSEKCIRISSVYIRVTLLTSSIPRSKFNECLNVFMTGELGEITSEHS